MIETKNKTDSNKAAQGFLISTICDMHENHLYPQFVAVLSP